MLKTVLVGKNVLIHGISIEKRKKTAFFWEKLPKKLAH